MTQPSEKKTSSASARATGEPRAARPGGHYKLKLVIATIAAAILAGLLAWQLVRVSALERGHAAQRATLVKEHTQALDNQAEQLLRTSGSLLRWVIAAPLVSESFDTIEERIKPLVREESIMVVAVADTKHTIRVATNHKLESKPLDVAFPGLPKTESDIVVRHLDSGLIAVIPVLDQGREVGRAVLYYEHRHHAPAAAK